MPFSVPENYCEWYPELCGNAPYNTGNSGSGNSGGGWPAGGAGNAGNVVIMGSGGATQGNTLNTVIQGILSGLAIFQHQPYVPTQVQPQQQPIIYQQPTGSNYNTSYGSGNTAGNLQRFLEQNKGAVILALVGVGLFMMRPPSRAR